MTSLNKAAKENKQKHSWEKEIADFVGNSNLKFDKYSRFSTIISEEISNICTKRTQLTSSRCQVQMQKSDLKLFLTTMAKTLIDP